MCICISLYILLQETVLTSSYKFSSNHCLSIQFFWKIFEVFGSLLNVGCSCPAGKRESISFIIYQADITRIFDQLPIRIYDSLQPSSQGHMAPSILSLFCAAGKQVTMPIFSIYGWRHRVLVCTRNLTRHATVALT